MIRIDRQAAERVLRDQAELSDRDSGDERWIGRIEELSRLCEVGNIRTHIAFLGTALLAKSVDARADLVWIKPKHAADAPFAFSARTLSEHVLVPVAADVGIHIGVTGAQPLNNQPYFRMTYLGDATPISQAGRPAFDYLRGLVEELKAMSADESRNALRAFVTVRRRYQPRYTEHAGELHVTPTSLAAAIVAFVGENSEGGKRAQACVAGLFDATFGHASVISGRINDPSRDKPGDVCVLADGRPYKAIEVKDKPVSFNDVQIFGKKAVDMGVTDAAYVMVASRQERLDAEALARWADGFGLSLSLFYDWTDLVTSALYWSPMPANDAAKLSATRIRERLISMEALQESVASWVRRIAG
ncbi:restriction endonuclease, SacI family [Aureimonas mangrovi]|uniref:restriction endonuclease, SacI family n=1 Tax=Aureimonas mangrovi TaxID=2758041 RepID=UPI00163D9BAE|nr:restriction endonuclease, SacI family [Aureimonas mangrovi]